MRAVGIKELKNKLSAYLRLVAAGETVLVTDRDRVVAELGPPAAGRGRTLDDAWLAQAVREGWLTPPLVRSPLPERSAVRSARELLADLDEDRAER